MRKRFKKPTAVTMLSSVASYALHTLLLFVLLSVISVCLPVILCGQRYALQQGPRTIYANTKVRATVNFFGPSHPGDITLLPPPLLIRPPTPVLSYRGDLLCWDGPGILPYILQHSYNVETLTLLIFDLTLEGYIAESYLAD